MLRWPHKRVPGHEAEIFTMDSRCYLFSLHFNGPSMPQTSKYRENPPHTRLLVERKVIGPISISVYHHIMVMIRRLWWTEATGEIFPGWLKYLIISVIHFNFNFAT